MGRKELPLEYDPNGQLYFGSNIRVLRNEKIGDISIFAKRVRYSPSQTIRIETNQAFPSDTFVERAANTLRVEVGELLSYPLHPRVLPRGRPRLERYKTAPQNRMFFSFEDQVNRIMAQSNLTPEQQHLIQQILLDTASSLSRSFARTQITN